ncbi:hypothetical protein [Phaeovulum sp.]|jgi:hypothetical protein|uniref:hypothetical protein n=1 Tax=Phaeovulum sp. TaxID=2934796 RepID=UPI0027316480|nr:hypothetical protein [Phaeovulum sp.]MDP1667455.1 hypothetical protein [Phaeovulum sp.]MDP2063649.1 hypothetical protein [Phaeovulum sp.]MDP3860296.1 hypothetical protein [Phaeovulum sp.]MDZ4119972.1 hypothetical protein [Phaeovulum sp.]
MSQKTLLAALGFGALILAAPQVHAEATSCGPRAQVLAELAMRYGESRRAAGLASNQALVELFASEETGSWTITLTLASGLTCLLVAGEAYEALSVIPGSGA